MPIPVFLADDILNDARREAELRGRSVTDQIAHWVKIGLTIEKSPGFDLLRVKDALEAELSPDELMPAEQAFWFDQFVSVMAVPTKHEEEFHAQREKLGRGVGMSSSGEIVYAKQK